MKGREGFKNKTDRSWAPALSAIIIQHQDPTYKKNMVSKGPKMA